MQIGVRVLWVTWRCASMFPGGTGSSSRSRSKGSSAWASLIASLTPYFQWASMATMTSGPTASRTARTTSAIQAISAEPIVRLKGSNQRRLGCGSSEMSMV